MPRNQEVIDQRIEQILWGKSVCTIGTQDFILRSLSIQESNKLNFLYNKTYNSAILNGVMSLQDLEELFESQNIWGDNERNRLEELDKEISLYSRRIAQYEFQNFKKKPYMRKLKKATEEKSELNQLKNQIFSVCAENRAEEIKRREMVRLCTQNEDEEQFWKTREDFLSDRRERLIDQLAISYYKENFLNQAEIREIARNNSWRFRWGASKNGADLFGKPIAEWSEMQNALVFWSQYYDSVFEHPDCPSQSVIESDEELDAWITGQNKKSTSAKVASKITKGKNHQEVFIMTDRADKESIERIQSLNPDEVRARQRAKQKLIEEKGKVSAWDMAQWEKHAK